MGHLDLPDDVIAEISRIAAERGVPPAEVVRELLGSWLRQSGVVPPPGT